MVRDGEACVRCGTQGRLQVHHLTYRSPWESCTLVDVETVCRKCHRLEHGLGPTDAQVIAQRLEKHFGIPERPPKILWLEFKAAMTSEQRDLDAFADLMRGYIYFVLEYERESGKENWWMDQETNRKWRRLWKAVHKSISERNLNVRQDILTNV